MQQHVPSSGLLHGKAYDTKENAIRNVMQQTGNIMNPAVACRPSSAPSQSFGSESPYIEHTRRDSRGVTVTKRYLKGVLLGKGGFAKCFKITDVDTNTDWACKVVQKSSLTKQRHKVKVCSFFTVVIVCCDIASKKISGTRCPFQAWHFKVCPDRCQIVVCSLVSRLCRS